MLFYYHFTIYISYLIASFYAHAIVEKLEEMKLKSQCNEFISLQLYMLANTHHSVTRNLGILSMEKAYYEYAYKAYHDEDGHDCGRRCCTQ